MKKAFDQTVRDIKRGVNKKVLKVPSIEQKVLDATSNESWGPHGSLLADIAQASRNYHEYQMIMSVIWKRVNDTGKNWRHVYKGLTVLEYLVANGSERVIDEIREHAYQVSSLSDFQYIDSTGRDQGNNVRKKSQSLVALVNDKEKIQEVREKAAANWDKFHNTSGGGKYRPGGYDDNRNEGRYGSRDEDRTREREWGDDKYGRYGDSYGEERYSRDEEYRGRRSVDGDNYGRRSRSSDREKERAYEDDGQYSSRESNEKADDQSHDGRHLEQKSSEQNSGGPPSYEDAVGGGRSPVYSEGEAKFSSPPVTTTHETTVASSPVVVPAPVAATLSPPPVATTLPPPAAASNKENDGFDEFDPRGSIPGTTAAPATSGGAEIDLFGSFSDNFSSDALALVPTANATTTSEVNTLTNSNPPGQSFLAASSAPAGSSQAFEDPFGDDNPFRAVPSTDGFSGQPQSTSAFGQSVEPPQSTAPVLDSDNNFGYGGSFDQNTDILADLLPPSGPSQSSFHAQPAQLQAQTGFLAQPNPTQFASSFPGQPGQLSFQGGQLQPQPGFPNQDGQFMPPHGGQTMSQPGFPPHGGQNAPLGGFPVQATAVSQAGFPVQTTAVSQAGFPVQTTTVSETGFPVQTTAVSQAGFPGSNGQLTHLNNFYGSFPAPVPAVTQVTAAPAAQSNTSNFYQQPQLNTSTGALAIVPQQEAKFETKSTVWADTLNRGLVNLNISGSKTNPLADIGVDFEALNRKERRMEKPSMVPMTSNVTMGKAMGSGTGIGRAGVGALRAQPNPMMGLTMAGPGAAPGYGAGYGGINQPMGQGFPPPGSAMAGSYNPMMGGGGYGQQPYGGGYR